MPKVTIEKDIPLPTLARVHDYPFEDMDVGDSFLLPDDFNYHSARAASTTYAKQSGKRFTWRKTKEGARCWRAPDEDA